MLFKKILANIAMVLSQDPHAVQEIKCMQEVVYYEARGEPTVGQVGVASVVANRTKDTRWPDTFCEVVKQKKQFSYRNNGLQKRHKPYLYSVAEKRAYEQALVIAFKAYIGVLPDVTNGANHFHNPYLSRPSWGRKFEVTAMLGNHRYSKA